MPSIKYALEKQGPKRVVLTWDLGWKNVVARLDGQEVGRVSTRAELTAGQEFPLPDGSRLRLQLKEGMWGPQLAVLRNGAPLPGSTSDPETNLKSAAGCAYFIGGCGVVLGGLAAMGVDFLARIGFTGFDVGYGLLFLILAHFTSRRSTVALGFAVGIHALVSIGALAAGGPVSGAIVMRVLLLVGMWQGFGAIKELHARDAAVAVPPGAQPAAVSAGSAASAAPTPVAPDPVPLPSSLSAPAVVPAPQPPVQPQPVLGPQVSPQVVPAPQPASVPQPVQPEAPRSAPPIPRAANPGQPGVLVLRVSTGRTVPLGDDGWLSITDLPGLQSAGGPGVAQVCRNPSDPGVRGLRNGSQAAWTAYMPNGSVLEVAPGRTVRLAEGVRIQFGMVEAEVMVEAAVPVEVNTVW